MSDRVREEANPPAHRYRSGRVMSAERQLDGLAAQLAVGERFHDEAVRRGDMRPCEARLIRVGDDEDRRRLSVRRELVEGVHADDVASPPSSRSAASPGAVWAAMVDALLSGGRDRRHLVFEAPEALLQVVRPRRRRRGRSGSFVSPSRLQSPFRVSRVSGRTSTSTEGRIVEPLKSQRLLPAA